MDDTCTGEEAYSVVAEWVALGTVQLIEENGRLSSQISS
jgi:hypothetical protein